MHIVFSFVANIWMTFAIENEISRKWKKHIFVSTLALQWQPSDVLKEPLIQIKSLHRNGTSRLAAWKLHDLRSQVVRLAAASMAT
jgi:hypothetical protein